jgi:hypothetical protein
MSGGRGWVGGDERGRWSDVRVGDGELRVHGEVDEGVGVHVDVDGNVGMEEGERMGERT